MNKFFKIFLFLIIFNVDASPYATPYNIDQDYIDRIVEEGMSPTPVDQHGTAITSSSFECRYDPYSASIPSDQRFKYVLHNLIKPGGELIECVYQLDFEPVPMMITMERVLKLINMIGVLLYV